MAGQQHLNRFTNKNLHFLKNKAFTFISHNDNIISMSIKRWSLESATEAAKTTTSMKEFQSKFSGAYGFCRNNSLLDSIRSLFPNGNIWWTKEMVIATAKKFNTVLKWRTTHSAAYSLAKEEGFLEEATSHMKNVRKTDWTKEECAQRASQYRTPGEWSDNDWASYKAAHNHGWHKEIVSTMDRVQKTWDYENVKVEALKYSTRAQWKDASPGSYNHAKNHTILDEMSKHMDKLDSWTDFNVCFQEALKYKTRSEFQKYSGSCYMAAKRYIWLDDICSHMPKHSSKSVWQKEIQEFLTKYSTYEVINDDWSCLKDLEIDHYIPSLKLGIEDSGLHWHSEQAAYSWLKSKYSKSISWEDLLRFTDAIYSVRKSHKEKLNLMRTKGERLITIYENEWRDRKPQIKNYLRSLLNSYDHKIYARNCQIDFIPKNEALKFIEDHHIQGANNNKGLFWVGLRFENKLIGIMEAAAHHRQLHDCVVLSRMCFENGYQVSGGASKMFTAFKKEAIKLGYGNVVSWSDNRWSEGNVYDKMGFILEEELAPDYAYVKNHEIYSKQSLKKNPKKDNMSKTEYELRLEQGYYRIYDCGKKRWILTL